MQSCLCFSRLGKPLLRSYSYHWALICSRASLHPNVVPSNGRFSHSGQPKVRKVLQKEIHASGSSISQLISRPPWEGPFLPFLRKAEDGSPVRMLDENEDRVQVLPVPQSRPVQKRHAIKANTRSHMKAAPRTNAPLPTLRPLKSAQMQTSDAPADTSLCHMEEDGTILEKGEWSPAIVLGRFLEARDNSERERYYTRMRRYTRSLPMITMHYLFRGHFPRSTWVQQDFDVHREARAYLNSRGIGWNKVNHWAWTLSGSTPDEMAERLLSKPKMVPPFILLEILRREPKVKTLEMLFDYVRDYMLSSRDPPQTSVPQNQTDTTMVIDEFSRPDAATSRRKTAPLIARKSEEDFVIEENAFTVLITRLLYQARRIWPSAMVDVAHMIAQYLQSPDSTLVRSVPAGAALDPRTFVRFCKMNNYFLRLLALPSSIEPVQSMAYNWSAQKVLLELAGQFNPPLRLDHSSYRAVIQVLTASKKSERESRSVHFRNRSWPPWRVEQDGMDAQRSQEEDFSRVISGIMRSKESGYTQDSQLSIFGGVDTDGTPTIHTRKLLKSRSLDSLTRIRGTHDDEARLWAARIEATRDVYEAWSAFTEFRRQGGKATIAMYFAMFQKLNYESRRSGLQSELHAPPGDAREVLPVSDDNFSEFYKSRLQPPTMHDLYQEMITSGIRPAGRCLSFLLRHARTTDEGFRYLLDSGLDEQVVAYLANSSERKAPLYVRAQVPDPMLADLVSLICRFAPRLVKSPFDSELDVVLEHVSNTGRRNSSPGQSEVWTIREAVAGEQHHSSRGHPLKHAAFLLKWWQPRFRPAWYALFKCLARRDIVVIRDLATDSLGMCENHELAWQVTRLVLQDFHSCDLELDPEGFRLICQTFAKYAEAAFHSSDSHRESLIKTSQIIKAECAKLTNGDENVSGSSKLRHIMEGVHLHAYIRAMGLVGDHAAIVSLLRWMVENHEELDAIASQGANGQRMLRQTVVAIKVFCDATDNAVATAQDLVEQVESWGGWPSEEEAEDYLDRGNHHMLDTDAESDDGEEDD